jgi:hypothetical protein
VENFSFTPGRRTGGKVQLHSFLALALEEGEWLAFTPRPLYTREKIKEEAE